ncbi:MAG: hypothetical protein QM401_04235 [Bacillota bacterium]|nr:hypothetical protein [Bacillota bacterium]
MEKKPRFDDYLELLNLLDHQGRLIKQQSSIINELTLKTLEQESIISELLLESKV